MLGFTRGLEAERPRAMMARHAGFITDLPGEDGGVKQDTTMKTLWNSGIASFPESENVDFRVPAFLDGGYLSTDTSNCA